MLYTCKHCLRRRVKRIEAVYCSAKCYTDSGRRKEAGIVNGSQAYKLYWKKFDEVFTRKYGHLDRVTQIRMLINIGMRRAYRKTYNQKFVNKKEVRDD